MTGTNDNRPEFEPMFFTNKEIEELPITILGIVKEVRRSL